MQLLSRRKTVIIKRTAFQTKSNRLMINTHDSPREVWLRPKVPCTRPSGELSRLAWICEGHPMLTLHWVTFIRKLWNTHCSIRHLERASECSPSKLGKNRCSKCRRLQQITLSALALAWSLNEGRLMANVMRSTLRLETFLKAAKMH